jgi:sulfur-carrier protein
MSVIVRVPGPLRGYTGGRGEVTIDASPRTVSEALAAVWLLHPALRDRIVAENGAVRTHVNIFVGGESIRYTGGLDTKIENGGTITIIPAVSGG